MLSQSLATTDKFPERDGGVNSRKDTAHAAGDCGVFTGEGEYGREYDWTMGKES